MLLYIGYFILQNVYILARVRMHKHFNIASITKNTEFASDFKDLIANLHRLADKNNQQTANNRIENFMKNWEKY